MEDVFIAAIGTIGVPAAISFYVLTRVTDALNRLTEAITHLEAKLDARR